MIDLHDRELEFKIVKCRLADACLEHADSKADNYELYIAITHLSAVAELEISLYPYEYLLLPRADYDTETSRAMHENVQKLRMIILGGSHGSNAE